MPTSFALRYDLRRFLPRAWTPQNLTLFVCFTEQVVAETDLYLQGSKRRLLRVVKGTRFETWHASSKGDKVGLLFPAFAESKGLRKYDLEFSFLDPLSGSETYESLGMLEGDVIHVSMKEEKPEILPQSMFLSAHASNMWKRFYRTQQKSPSRDSLCVLVKPTEDYLEVVESGSGTLTSDGLATIYLCRPILEAFSAYFKEFFESNDPSDSGGWEIKLPSHFNSGHVESIVLPIYTGKEDDFDFLAKYEDFKDEDYVRALHLADMWGVLIVKDMLQVKLARMLSESNVDEFYDASRSFNAKFLAESCRTFWLKKGEATIKSPSPCMRARMKDQLEVLSRWA